MTSLLDHAPGMSRRRAIAGMATLVATCSCRAALAQTAPQSLSASYRIDTHHHIFPPAFLAEERERVMQASPGLPPNVIDQWSPQVALEDMDKNGLATAVVSISTPGVWMGNVEEGRRLSRLCNEYGAKLIADHPGRFGMFAALPLPDIEGSLSEIEYALDVLKLTGIGLLTSYGDRWPGDPAFYRVFEELNRRKAVVYFHPTAPDCCRNLGQDTLVQIEYPTDTTRCAASLYIGGVLSRCRDITFILSHGGGSLPAFGSRLDTISGPPDKPRWPTRAIDEFMRLNYDTAAVLNQPAMAALRKFVPASQILMGTDFPYRSAGRAVKDIRELGVFSESELIAIERDNALRLLPRLKV